MKNLEWTAQQVSARIRALSDLSRDYEPNETPDMSPGAVTQRLIECAEISALTWQLWTGELHEMASGEGAGHARGADGGEE